MVDDWRRLILRYANKDRIVCNCGWSYDKPGQVKCAYGCSARKEIKVQILNQWHKR